MFNGELDVEDDDLKGIDLNAGQTDVESVESPKKKKKKRQEEEEEENVDAPAVDGRVVVGVKRIKPFIPVTLYSSQSC